MNTLTRVAVGYIVFILLAAYVTYLYLWLRVGHSDHYWEAAAHHVIVLFVLSVLYLVGLGIYKVWKAVKR